MGPPAGLLSAGLAKSREDLPRQPHEWCSLSSRQSNVARGVRDGTLPQGSLLNRDDEKNT